MREKDPDGRIVVHHRTVDTLGKMLRSVTITQEMHDAAKDFQAAFIIANLDPLRALPILRVPGTGREPELNERQLHARRRVHKALAGAGWHLKPGGLLRLARSRAAAKRARVGDPPGLERAADRPEAGAGHSGRGARGAGGALGVRRREARLLKDACADLGRRLPDRRADIGSGHGNRHS